LSAFLVASDEATTGQSASSR